MLSAQTWMEVERVLARDASTQRLASGLHATLDAQETHVQTQQKLAAERRGVPLLYARSSLDSVGPMRSGRWVTLSCSSRAATAMPTHISRDQTLVAG